MLSYSSHSRHAVVGGSRDGMQLQYKCTDTRLRWQWNSTAKLLRFTLKGILYLSERKNQSFSVWFLYKIYTIKYNTIQ